MKEKVKVTKQVDEVASVVCDVCGAPTNPDTASKEWAEVKKYHWDYDENDHEYFDVCSPECMRNQLAYILSMQHDEIEITVSGEFTKKLLDRLK